MYYFLYEIKVENKDSSLNDCYYYGKHKTSNLQDGYYGSGKLITAYQNKYGTNGLKKTILKFFNDEPSLNKAEYDLIKEKKELLGNKCLNLNDGGLGSFTYINKTITEEQKHKNAVIGGLANKKRLENPEVAKKWSEQVSQMHKNMTKKEKESRYSKVSQSLKDYYKTEEGQKELQQRNLKNKKTNQEVAKEWRTEFKALFRNKQPESFRKYGKQKAAHDLFKEIKNEPQEIQTQKVNEFFKMIEEIV